MISQSFFISMALLFPSISASILIQPPATHVLQPQDTLPQASIPKPTEPTSVQDLRKRQNLQKTLIAAPDPTCGYFNGSSDQPWGCSTGNCVFATATSSFSNATQTAGAASILCCDPKTGCPSQPAPTACVDKGRNEYNKTCTGSCPDDPATLKCTSGIKIYCNTLTFLTPNISAFFCNYISTYAILRAETTFTGQTDRVFTPTVPVFAVSSTATSSTPVASAEGTTSSSATGVPTTFPGKGEGKSVDKKAVIGGSVGGVLGLVVLVAAGLCFWRRRKTPLPAEEGKVDGSEKIRKRNEA